LAPSNKQEKNTQRKEQMEEKANRRTNKLTNKQTNTNKNKQKDKQTYRHRKGQKISICLVFTLTNKKYLRNKK
jgi:hypothetical protein